MKTFSQISCLLLLSLFAANSHAQTKTPYTRAGLDSLLQLIGIRIWAL